MSDSTEELEALLRRYRDPDADPLAVPRVSLAEAVARGTDPLDAIAYLSGLGIEVRSLDDLLKINADPDEEEMHCFRVREGVAVTIASQNEWLVFLP